MKHIGAGDVGCRASYTKSRGRCSRQESGSADGHISIPCLRYSHLIVPISLVTFTDTHPQAAGPVIDRVQQLQPWDSQPHQNKDRPKRPGCL